MSTIPKLHYVSQGNSPVQHIDRIREACTSGAELVQLDMNECDHETFLKTAQEARAITSLYQTRLIISEHHDIAKSVKADGVFLSNLDSCPLKIREGLLSWQIIGATANTLEECKTLLTKNVDYIGLGTLEVTGGLPLNIISNVKAFTKMIASANSETPMIVFGDMELEDVSNVLKAGAYGVALSQTLTNDFKKISDYKKLLGNPSSQEQVWISKDHKL